MHLDFLHVVDSNFPSGAYVHSFGLETLAPQTTAELEPLLTTRVLEPLGRFELVFLRHAYTTPLPWLDERFECMLFPRESREASSLIGASLLRSACDLFDAPRLRQFLEDGLHRHQPIAFGAIASALGVSPAQAAEVYAFQSLRASVSVMQRLGRIGQRDAQQLLHRLKPVVQSAVATALDMTLDQAGAFAPVWDIASMRHERAAVRMFAS